jgi:hypothetical protein
MWPPATPPRRSVPSRIEFTSDINVLLRIPSIRVLVEGRLFGYKMAQTGPLPWPKVRPKGPCPMPVLDLEPALAALNRLVAIAQSDTGQSRRVANFLLAWWNAGDCGGFDFTDLWAVDRGIAEDILTVAQLIALRHEYPGVYGLGPQFEQLVADWRPHLVAPPAGDGPQATPAPPRDAP